MTWSSLSHPEQNGRHFEDDIFKRELKNSNLNLHRSLFLRVQLTITTGLDYAFAPKRWQAIISIKGEYILWRINTALGGGGGGGGGGGMSYRWYRWYS